MLNTTFNLSGNSQQAQYDAHYQLKVGCLVDKNHVPIIERLEYISTSIEKVKAYFTSSINQTIVDKSLVQQSEMQCPQYFDGLHCWPSTPSGHRILQPCFVIFQKLNDFPSNLHRAINSNNSTDDAYAYRICDFDGHWRSNRTNYTECLQILNKNEEEDHQSTQMLINRAIVLIVITCSLISLLFLLVTLFIFYYFKSIVNCRVRVHRNLAAALTINAFLLVILSNPFLGTILNSGKNNSITTLSPSTTSSPSLSSSSIYNITQQDEHSFNSTFADYFCRSVIIMKIYSMMATINWMFIEGLLLTSRITVSIFRKDAPYKLYHFIGWGLPAVLVTVWAIKMSTELNSYCWSGYAKLPYIYIIVGPLFAAVIINFFFLINIIRILMVTVRSNSNMELAKVRKAVKATALLFPLLGLQHLFFCFNPDDNPEAESVYMMANAILQSSQGIFVAILYCFMDSDVRSVLRKAWNRNYYRSKACVSLKKNEPNNRRSFHTACTFCSIQDQPGLDGLYQNGSSCSLHEMQSLRREPPDACPSFKVKYTFSKALKPTHERSFDKTLSKPLNSCLQSHGQTQPEPIHGHSSI